eukprot:1153812-Pelagomonas_calceolata.AAC.3
MPAELCKDSSVFFLPLSNACKCILGSCKALASKIRYTVYPGDHGREELTAMCKRSQFVTEQ